ncbi:MAG TPA: TRAP transporter fused permease subunit [Syntrophorhabdaceae bacterium]|nr:TRAP transporter fused permease subunit [Syntrophorhabdaceae bacterium]HOF57791.1 TRAP transporter fused permease subunit [Syntrophorhabdaceae bacterium]HOS05723.1 TRAP transporter fused permease subunit [Syntrophorhabdaceae bacterium]HPL40972.1 TRAP transporter fused permease subunit [Syntrophorhabdaceae bacterium]
MTDKDLEPLDNISENLTEEQKKKLEKIIEEEEGVTRKVTGFWNIVITVLAVAMSLFALYTSIFPVTTQIVRGVHVALLLAISFLFYPITKKYKGKINYIDVGLSILGLVCILYMLIDFEDFIYRAVTPELWDMIFGISFLVLILEATRRSSGWIMPLTCIIFLVYAYIGPLLPAPWTHRGYDLERIVGHMYMTLEGIFGVPIDVSSTIIIMFCIFGSFLTISGAGKFYVDFAFTAMGSKPTAAGRSVIATSYLLAMASGSGVANTVAIGSVAYPMLEKSGYDKDSAGGFLAAGGMGAITTPPVMGAAAFLIAEFLRISYVDVILLAIIPAALFYWGLLVMVEFDAKKFGLKAVKIEKKYTLMQLTKMYGFHFLPLIAIVAFLVKGFTPQVSVFAAILTCFFVSFIRKDTRFTVSKTIEALKQGSLTVLNVAAICASAGIIVGTVSLTGLGLKLSSIIISYAGGNLIMTTVFTGVLLWVIGLAVPITATYIIAAVIAAPALTQLGVPEYAAHMFIFYYALLSEVSPPTALSPFAAAAITGGNPYKTTMMAWKYTITAFLMPFIFTVLPSGRALLLHWEGIGVASGVWTIFAAFVGIGMLASGCSGWLIKRSNILERVITIIGALAFVYPSRIGDVLGFACLLFVIIMQMLRKGGTGQAKAVA